MTIRSHTRNAMTAIEVLAATTLASLMLASVMGLLGALARQERSLRQSSTAPAWHRQLADQLQWDLRNARQVVAVPSGVRLVGYGGRDFSTDRPTGRPTEVDYYLMETAGSRWLVRREAHTDEQTTDSRRTEIVCRGVDRFEWGTVVIDRPIMNSAGLDLPASDIPLAIPERTVVRLYEAGRSEPIFAELFLVP
jgi:hypothetical protein